MFTAAGKPAALVAITAALTLGVGTNTTHADQPKSLQVPAAPFVQTIQVSYTAQESAYDEVRDIKLAQHRQSLHVQHLRAMKKKNVQPSVQKSGCTASNWRSTMTADEVWIDTRESTLNPYASNGQYHGLGQLGPQYSWTTDPCQQLTDQRDYIANRYGSEDNAVAFWSAHSWY